MRIFRRGLLQRHAVAFAFLIALTVVPLVGRAQQSSVSAWDAADFRIWSFVPYWTETAQINTFAGDGVYDHVSDVIYHAGYHPKADGTLFKHNWTDANLGRLKTDSEQYGFRLMMDMFDTNGGSVDSVWTTITGNASIRATFVNNVKTIVDQWGLAGVNLDWERPDTATKWGNYTQLARELGTALNPAGQQHRVEISVDDYGSTSSLWDNTSLFDARVYDQIMMMAYHYAASSQASFADGKKNLTGQGAQKAFTDEQIVIGMGTWGTEGPATKGLKAIVAANPNLPGDATTYTGTVYDPLNGTHTGTWKINSRYMVRDNVQLALDRGQPGVMFWTLHYDAVGKMSLHRVAHHYAMFKQGIPDLDLNGEVDAADANALADNMGSVPGWTGTNTPARMETFYMRGNWEQGDRDGNGFVNHADADWLAGRFATLGVALPDRLAFTGTFEKLGDTMGLNGRWQAQRNGSNQLVETGNFNQRDPGYLSFSASGTGADKFSNTAVTIRQQNGAEAFDGLNTTARKMSTTLSTPIDLAENEATYLTFLVRQDTAGLTATQLASPNRTLTLELQTAGGQAAYDFAFFGQQTDFGIRSQADAAGQDVTADGFAAGETFLFVGKISGNGTDANKLQASLFAPGSTVGNFTAPDFQWMLSADGGSGYNPVITQLQFTSLFEANYTVSSVIVGSAIDFFGLSGDFDADGDVDGRDFLVWQRDPNIGDLADWQNYYGTGSLAAIAAVPEPHCLPLLIGLVFLKRTRLT
jgi:GH18 family chitinase